MAYYNIVLLPNEILSQAVTKWVNKRFSLFADGYCLSSEVFPHITLSQFKTEKKQKIINVVEKIRQNQKQGSVEYGSTYINAGSNIHSAFNWLGLEIIKTPWLMNMHKKSVLILDRENLQPLNSYNKDYWPHMTFCRVSNVKTLPEFELPSNFFNNYANNWYLDVGLSDMNGQFLGAI